MTPTTNRCLDGETLAAWVDGGLTRNDAAMAEAHVSTCPRCQEIAGLIVKTTPDVVVDPPWWRKRAAWLIPATVGVTAAGLLMIAPADRTVAPVAPAGTAPTVTAPPASVAVESAQKADSPAVRAVAPPAEPTSAPAKLREAKKERRREDQAANVAPAPAAAPAPPSVAPQRVAEAQERPAVAADQVARQIRAEPGAKAATSPRGELRWRITDRGALERSADGGTTWQAVDIGMTATFTTVQAPDARTALVTTSDGRVFRTTDGGTTWQLVAPKL